MTEKERRWEWSSSGGVSSSLPWNKSKSRPTPPVCPPLSRLIPHTHTHTHTLQTELFVGEDSRIRSDVIRHSGIFIRSGDTADRIYQLWWILPLPLWILMPYLRIHKDFIKVQVRGKWGSANWWLGCSTTTEAGLQIPTFVLLLYTVLPARPASRSFCLNVIVHQKNHNLNPKVYFENRCGNVCKLQRAEAQEDEVIFYWRVKHISDSCVCLCLHKAIDFWQKAEKEDSSSRKTGIKCSKERRKEQSVHHDASCSPLITFIFPIFNNCSPSSSHPIMFIPHLSLYLLL